DAFCTQLQKVLARYGLIVVDPLDARLKQLVSPIYASAARSSSKLVDALVARSGEIEADGYQPQVLVTPDYFPLFYHTDDGVRRSVRQRADGKYHVADTKSEFDVEEVAKL